MKSLGSNALANFGGTAAKACAFVQFDFTSSMQRYTTLPYSTTWNGYTWTGVGALASIEEIRESEALVATGVRIVLSGIPSALVSLVLSENIQSKDCTIWFAALGSDNQVQDTPPVEFKGSTDNPEIAIDRGAASITINVESKLADFARPRVRRYNDADQQHEYAGDKFMEFVPQMAERELAWPSRAWFVVNG